MISSPCRSMILARRKLGRFYSLLGPCILSSRQMPLFHVETKSNSDSMGDDMIVIQSRSDRRASR